MKQSLATAFYRLAITVWVGGMLATGYLAAPVLFSQLTDRATAGQLAGAMFSAMAWVGVVCAAYLLIFLVRQNAGNVTRAISNPTFRLVAIMLVLTLIGHFGIAPVIAHLKAEVPPGQVMDAALKGRFGLWHGTASSVFLLQSLLGIALVVLQERGLVRTDAQ